MCREEHSKEVTFELRYMIKHHRKSRRQKVPDGGNVACKSPRVDRSLTSWKKSKEASFS